MSGSTGASPLPFSHSIKTFLQQYRSQPYFLTADDSLSPPAGTPTTPADLHNKAGGAPIPHASRIASCSNREPTFQKKEASPSKIISPPFVERRLARVSSVPTRPKRVEKPVSPSSPWDVYGFESKLHKLPHHLHDVLIVKNYSSVITAHEDQPIFIVLANKAVADTQYLATIGNTVITMRRCGDVLTGSLSPQSPGDIYLSLAPLALGCRTTGSSNPTVAALTTSGKNMIFQMAHQDTAMGPFISALPITVVSVPCFLDRPPPRLAYTVPLAPREKPLRRERGEAWSGTRYAATPKKHSNLFQRLHNLHKKCTVEGVYSGQDARIRELKLTIATLDAAAVDSVVPFVLRSCIYFSIPVNNRHTIQLFHSRLFQLSPFSVTSAHVFTKEKPQDTVYTVFAFTVTPEPLLKDTGDTPNTPGEKTTETSRYIASLDRFEATARLCTDPRYWHYVDGVVPSKPKYAEQLRLEANWQETPIVCGPIPPPMCASGPQRFARVAQEALEIAPLVYLHWEPWPLALLREARGPSKDSPHPASSRLSSPFPLVDNSVSTSPPSLVMPTGATSKAPPTSGSLATTFIQYKQPDGTGTSMTVAVPEAQAPPTSQISAPPQQSVTIRQFGLSICVGEHVYTSVTGVDTSVVEFLINQWLQFVPVARRSRGRAGTLAGRYRHHSRRCDDAFPSFLTTSIGASY